MAATLEQPVPVDEPAITHDPPLGQPVLDDSNIKAMAAKFKTNWPGADGKAAPKPETPGDSGGARPSSETTQRPDDAGRNEPGADKVAGGNKEPADPTDVPPLAPTAPLNRDHFKRLEAAKNSYKERATKFEAEVKATAERAKALEEELAKTKAALPPNLEEVQKSLADAKRHAEENAKLTETLETINLERSPRFQNWWKTETDKHIRVAQSHVPPEHREEFAKLLLAPSSPERNAALDAIVEPLPPTSKRLATGALEAIESLKIQREDALTQGSAKWKELQAHERAEAEKVQRAQQAKIQAATEEAIRRAKAGYTAFQPTGDAAKDAEIAGREAFVRALVTGKVDEDTMLNVPAAAVEMLHLRDNVIPGLKAELAKQAELIKQLQGSSPRPSEGKGGGGKTADVKGNDKGTSFASTVLANWAGKKP